jgi:hypothetical protein
MIEYFGVSVCACDQVKIAAKTQGILLTVPQTLS